MSWGRIRSPQNVINTIYRKSVIGIVDFRRLLNMIKLFDYLEVTYLLMKIKQNNSLERQSHLDIILILYHSTFMLYWRYKHKYILKWIFIIWKKKKETNVLWFYWVYTPKYKKNRKIIHSYHNMYIVNIVYYTIFKCTVNRCFCIYIVP